MRRTFLALMVGSMVFAGVYGRAASLNVPSSYLGAGSSPVAACQSDPISVGFRTAYKPSGTETTEVTISGIDTSLGACGGKTIEVTLTGPNGSNASLGQQTAITPTSGTTQTIAVSGVSASDVTGVRVTIAG